MQIDLVQLQTFIAVAEEQHLTRAAERLHISPSAASAQVRGLEERLRMQLFVRTNRSLELTRAGLLLQGKAKVLLDEAATFTSFARELLGKVEGTVVIGSSSDPASTRIGELVGATRARHPLVSVDLRARPSSGTHQALKTGELDIGLILGRPTDTGFTYYELARVPFKVAGPAAWREKIETANWAELAGLPWITAVDSSTAYSTILQQLFTDRGLELNSVAQFDNSALGRAMLDAGVGLMLMREEHVTHRLKQGSLVVSPIAHAELPILLTHVARRRNDPLVNAVMEAATDVWPELRVTPLLSTG